MLARRRAEPQKLDPLEGGEKIMALLGKSVKIFDTKTSGIPVDSVDLMLFQENHHEIVFATRSYTNSSIYI